MPFLAHSCPPTACSSQLGLSDRVATGLHLNSNWIMSQHLVGSWVIAAIINSSYLAAVTKAAKPRA